MYTLADFIKYKLNTDEEFAELWAADHQDEDSDTLSEDIEEVEYDYDVADLWKDDFDVATPDEVEKTFGVKVKNKPFEHDSDWVNPEWLVGKTPVLHSIGRIHHLLTWFDTEEEAEEFCEENEWEYKDDNDFVWNLEIYPEIEDKKDAERFYYGVLGNPRPGSVEIVKKKSVGESVDIDDIWCGSADIIDGHIEETHTYEEAEDNDFHHSLYFSPNVAEKITDGDSVFFFIDDGEIVLDPIGRGDDEIKNERFLINQIKKQLNGKLVEAVSPEGYAPSKTGKALSEAKPEYVDYKGKQSRLYTLSKKNKKTGDVTTRYFVKDKDYEPLQYEPDDINADVPDRVKFVGYKQFKTLYNPNDPSTEKYKGLLFPLFVGAKQKDGIEVGKWYRCGTGELRIEVDREGNPIPGGAIQVDSKLGNLAYRPGWHLSSAPVTRHIGVGQSRSVSNHNDYGAMYSENVWAKVEYSAHYDFTDKARQMPGADKDPKKAMFTDKSEIKNGFYHYRTNSNADETEDWLIADAIRVISVLSDDTVRKIANEHGLQAQDRWTADGTGGNSFVADFSQFSVVEDFDGGNI